MKDEIVKVEAVETEEIETDVNVPEELWFDPLVTIETVTYAMYSVSEIDFEGKQECLNDFGAILRQCNTTVFNSLKKFNIEQGYIKPDKKGKA